MQSREMSRDRIRSLNIYNRIYAEFIDIGSAWTLHIYYYQPPNTSLSLSRRRFHKKYHWPSGSLQRAVVLSWHMCTTAAHKTRVYRRDCNNDEEDDDEDGTTR